MVGCKGLSDYSEALQEPDVRVERLSLRIFRSSPVEMVIMGISGDNAAPGPNS